MLNKNIKKIDLVKNISSKTGLSKNFSKKLLEDLINLIILNIKNGNFYLNSIGNFRIINKKKRLGRNPKTREEFIISARKSISFVSSNKILNN